MLTADALLDYQKLARQGASFKGELPSGRFGRLAEWVDCKGPVSLSFSLSLDGEGRPRVKGCARLEVALVCQKCLGALETQLSCALDAVIVPDEAALAALPQAVDGLLAPGRRVAAVDLFEDELLLALPMAPRHGEGECSLPNQTRNCSKEKEQADGSSAEQGHPRQARPATGA